MRPYFIIVGSFIIRREAVAGVLERDVKMMHTKIRTNNSRYLNVDGYTYNDNHTLKVYNKDMLYVGEAEGYTYGLRTQDIDSSDFIVDIHNKAEVIKAYCTGRGRNCYTISIGKSKVNADFHMEQQDNTALLTFVSSTLLKELS